MAMVCGGRGWKAWMGRERRRSTNLPMYEPYQQKDERGETRDKRRKTPKENPPKEVTIH